MSADARGDGFYVDAVGQVRACRTDELAERPSAATVASWAARLDAALQCATIREGVNFLMVQQVRDAMLAWCAPDPMGALTWLRELDAREGQP